MKRIIVLGAAVLLFSLLVPHGAWAFGVKDVVEMHRDGIADSLIIDKIYYSGKTFHLEAGDLRALKQAGVSDEVISAMLYTEKREGGSSYYGGYYGGYYWPPYPRVIVGLGFGHYAPYYGGYWGPHRYYGHYGYYGRPSYGHFNSGRRGFGGGPSGFGHRR
jgi:hypothetical protein